GSQDGLVNVLGVILGVAVASRHLSNPLAIVLAGGFAATFAESISMGAVAYTSTVARRGHYLAERQRELEEMQTMPDLERQEVREILERWTSTARNWKSCWRRSSRSRRLGSRS